MVTPRSPLLPGGVERHVWEVATRLRQRGLEVAVMCADPGGLQPRIQVRDGIPIRSVRSWPRRSDWCLAPGIWRAIEPHKWDVVHVQSYHTFVAPLAMARAAHLGVPYCVTFHGGGSSSVLRQRARVVQRRMLRPLLVRAAALVAVARFEIDQYQRELRLPRARFRLIPNGVNLRLTPRKQGDEPRDGVVLASIGRLERYKGHQRVIAALPHVLASEPEARLQVVGSGPYEPELRRLVRNLGIKQRVQFASVTPGDDAAMAELLSHVSLVVLMSEYETHPLVALEALAARRRLLVADDGAGLRELADAGLTRRLALTLTPQEVATAILEELREPPKHHELKLTSWDECADMLAELYEALARR
jgi:glycosyltransferase involved in cell wall biosynthesis